jgi:hypothetical protein
MQDASSSTIGRADLLHAATFAMPVCLYIRMHPPSPVLSTHGPGAGDIAAVPVVLAAAIKQYHLITRHRLHSKRSTHQWRAGAVRTAVQQQGSTALNLQSVFPFWQAAGQQ